MQRTHSGSAPLRPATAAAATPPRAKSLASPWSWRMPENEPWDYTLYIPNDLRAVTVCRRTLRLILTMHGLIRLVDTAELVATELVTNAVRHTKGPAALRVRRSAEGVVWIGAWDSDPEPPGPPRPLERVDR